MNAKVLDLSTIKFQMKKDQIAEQERLAEQDRHRQGLRPARPRLPAQLVGQQVRQDGPVGEGDIERDPV